MVKRYGKSVSYTTSRITKRIIYYRFGSSVKGNTTQLNKQQLLLDKIHKNANSGKITGALFIDLFRAFNTLEHSKLRVMLKSNGLEDIELEWFTNYVFGGAQKVKVNEKLTKSCSVFCGILKGSILVPTLLLIFFNDFPKIRFRVNAIVFVSIKDVDSIEFILNEDLKSFSFYFFKMSY